jgi:tetratricopeptide (TPR) repeat protein
MSPARPKVFISYSHDSKQHEERVLKLAYHLADDGIEVALDRFVNPPPASWPRWMEEQMNPADYIVVVCSENYSAKVHGKVEKGTGKGVKWESLLSYQQIYDNDSNSSKFIPVLLEGGEYDHIPTPMKGGNHYRLGDDLENDPEYEKLLRHISDQPATPRPKPGPVKKLDPLPRPGAQPAASPKPAHAINTASTRLLNVPARNEAFTGREEILSGLRADLVKKSRQALFGLGGVGKTQIAAEYAYRHQDDYTAVLWTFAGTEQSVRGGFAAIAALLDLPEKESTEQSQVIEAVRRWLEQNSGWLLVLDNADDPAMIKPFLPPQGKGHVLLTSRAHTFQVLGILAPREIDVLSPVEAREFLLRRTGKDSAAKSPEADALAKELGYLPLALEQAAAYITETQASFATYLAAFKKQRLKVLERAAPVLGNEAREQQKRTVATTWALNFADVEKHFAASAELLRLSAFLAPDAIPLELLEKGGSQLPRPLAAKLAEAADNPLMLDELLSPLLRFSLVRRDEEKRTYSIHPLVQEVVRDGLGQKAQKGWSERVVRAVNASFPHIEFANWPQCDRLMPHALACAALIQLWGMEFAEAARIVNQAGYYLYERAEYLQAEPLFRWALAIREKVLGPEHPDTISSLNNLAGILVPLRELDKAEPLLRRALAICKKFAPELPLTATSLNNLASVFEDQGKFKEAEILYRQALAIREKALGPKHPDTATSLNNLASLLQDQGNLEESEPLYERALEICEKTLGPVHPDTATSLNNLAGLFYTQGKFGESETLYLRALAIREMALGLEHPYTVLVRTNLIHFYREQGRDAEADALERKAP